MSIQIYNSLIRKKEEFRPLDSKTVKMYVCGPTVYDQPHIGHARSAYIFDVIKRYLKYRGYEVKFVRNVTDVDDKIIDKARKEYPNEDLNVSFKKVAEKYLASYHEALKDLGIDDSGIIEPRASEYIPKMTAFISALIDKGAAYASAGDVYFDIRKAKDYGKLSNQSLEKMESGARIIKGENKRDLLDFALWKAAKEGEPSWDSPWGKGRPGWHIECSVMSSDILGDTFDIHGGGLDLIFPHHENEIAQSEGAGKAFARYWIHHGLLTINGQKMAKSLGNFVTITDFLAKYKNSDLLKLFFLSAHYSSPVDYTEEKIEEAKRAYEHIDILIINLNKILETKAEDNGSSGGFGEGILYIRARVELEAAIMEFEKKFIDDMDNDFNMPQGLAIIFGLVNFANKNIENIKRLDLILELKKALLKLTDILGLSLNKIRSNAQTITSNVSFVADVAIEGLIEKRNDARKSKNFKEADNIRKELEEKGVVLEDARDGKTTWRRKI